MGEHQREAEGIYRGGEWNKKKCRVCKIEKVIKRRGSVIVIREGIMRRVRVRVYIIKNPILYSYIL